MSRRICLLWLGLYLASPVTAAPSHALPAGAIKSSAEALATLRFSPGVTRAVVTLEADLRVAGKTAGAIAAWCGADDAILAGNVLARWLDRRVADSTGSPADIAALEELSECPERVFVRHAESVGDWWLPAHANGARARALLRALERDRLALRAATVLADKGAGGWQPQWDAAIAGAAVALLDPAQRAQLARSKSLSPTLLLALAAAGDAALIPEAIARAPSMSLLAVLPDLYGQLPPEQRLKHLDAGMARAELRSATILLTRDWPDDPRLDVWWLARLAEAENGASAAQVVAARWTPARVANELGAAQATTLQLHLALALRLNGSAQARDLLRNAADAGRLPPTVAEEVLR